MKDPLASLDWGDIRVFLIAVRYQRVSGAAKELRLSHSTVSRRLSRLEQVLGAALFERNRDGLILTTFGRSVLKRAEEISLGVNNLRSDIEGSGDTSGVVRFATMEGIASLYLASRLAGFQASYPHIQLELLTTAREVQISNREADILLSFHKPQGTDMVSKRVGTFGIGLYASQEYLATHGAPAKANQMADHSYIGYLDQFVELETVRWLEELIEHPRIVFRSNSMIVQRSAARGALGIVALPHFALSENETLVRVMPDLVARRPLWISVHQDLRNLPRIKAVQSYLDQLFDTNQAYLNGASAHSFG
ncbi:MAG: LysR family transcriptional regulator [Sulfitobacter sp.]